MAAVSEASHGLNAVEILLSLLQDRIFNAGLAARSQELPGQVYADLCRLGGKPLMTTVARQHG